MFTTISIKRLSVASVYKLFAIGLTCGFVPLGVVFGVLAFFGAKTVTWNGDNLTGFSGLLVGPALSVMIAFLFTLVAGSACALGLWLFSLVRPVEITVKKQTAQDAL